MSKIVFIGIASNVHVVHFTIICCVIPILYNVPNKNSGSLSWVIGERYIYLIKYQDKGKAPFMC